MTEDYNLRQQPGSQIIHLVSFPVVEQITIRLCKCITISRNAFYFSLIRVHFLFIRVHNTFQFYIRSLIIALFLFVVILFLAAFLFFSVCQPIHELLGLAAHLFHLVCTGGPLVIPPLLVCLLF